MCACLRVWGLCGGLECVVLAQIYRANENGDLKAGEQIGERAEAR